MNDGVGKDPRFKALLLHCTATSKARTAVLHAHTALLQKQRVQSGMQLEVARQLQKELAGMARELKKFNDNSSKIITSTADTGSKGESIGPKRS